MPKEEETPLIVTKEAPDDLKKPGTPTRDHDDAEKGPDPAAVARALAMRGVLHANSMGICAIVLVALGATLSDIARQCGTKATAVGTVFLARGAGATQGRGDAPL